MLLVSVCSYITKLIPLWLLLLAPPLLFPNPIRSIALFGLPSIMLLQKWQNGYFMRRTRLDWAIFFMLVMTLVSMYATFSIEFSLAKLCGLLFHIVVFYAVVETVQTKQGFMHSLVLYFMLGIAVAGLGLISTKWLFKIPFINDITQQLPLVIQGIPGAETGISPNQLAGTLIWFFPLQLSLLLCKQTTEVWNDNTYCVMERQQWFCHTVFKKFCRLTKPFLIIAFSLTIFTFILTQSRGGWVGGLVAMAFLGAITNKYIRGFVVVCIVAFIVGSSIIGWTTVGNLLVSDSTEAVVGNFNSLGFRMEVWRVALQGIADFPFTGMGLGTFREVARVLYPLNVQPDYDIAHAHNHFLQTALDLGIVGLIAYTAMWIYSGYMLFHTLRHGQDPFLQAIARGTASGLVGYFVYGLTDTIALGAKPSLFLWWLFAFSVGLYSINRIEETKL